MSRARPKPSPPTGLTPPARALGPDGAELDLVTLAREVVDRYYAEFDDEEERWGPAGRQWCQHDLQHKLNWAALAADGLVDLDREVAWLARILQPRGFPVDRLARSLDLAADVVRERVASGASMARHLDAPATMLRDGERYLTT